MRKLALICLFGLICPRVPAATLWTLYLVDRASGLIGDDMTDACRLNLSMMNEFYSAAAQKAGYELKSVTLTGPNGSPNAVYNFLTRVLRIEREDVLTFFYCGHGVSTPLGGHTFAMSNGRITRNTIRQALLRHGARFTILSSDTCSNYGLRAGSRGNARVDTGDPATAVDLLFGSKGFADITAASPGEYSVFDTDMGGFYTLQFAKTIWEPKANLDRNQDGRVSWSEFFPVVSQRTNAFLQWYKEAYPDPEISLLARTQFPSSWTLPN